MTERCRPSGLTGFRFDQAGSAALSSHAGTPIGTTIPRVADGCREVSAGWGPHRRISPLRVSGWFDRFGERHQGLRGHRHHGRTVTVHALDGATATVTVPFPPLATPEPRRIGDGVADLVAHLQVPRLVGLVLVRLGGHSVGIAEGGRVLGHHRPHPVHGRNKAGGWSQQRFARRRAGQARVALRSAADDRCGYSSPGWGNSSRSCWAATARTGRAARRPGLAEVFALARERILEVPNRAGPCWTTRPSGACSGWRSWSRSRLNRGAPPARSKSAGGFPYDGLVVVRTE